MKETVLVLGGAGFLGQHLVRALKASGDYRVLVFERSENDCPFGIETVADAIYRGDAFLDDSLDRVCASHKITTVFHLVSTTLPQGSDEAISFDVESNVLGTVRLLDTMRRHSIPRIVFISSGGTVYGNVEGDRRSEIDATNPLCSYGVTKLMVEKYLHLYRHLYGLEYLILRPSNVYGEYHRSAVQGLINVLLRRVLNGRAMEIWGDGNVIRDYVYAGDLAEICVRLVRKNVWNTILNVGSGIGYSIREILEFVRELVGPFVVEHRAPRKVDVSRVVLDVTKLRSILPCAMTEIRSGISKTWRWVCLQAKSEGLLLESPRILRQCIRRRRSRRLSSHAVAYP